MESIRDSLSEELVKMTEECEKLRSEVALLPRIKAELDSLKVRHSAALELMGERDEQVVQESDDKETKPNDSIRKDQSDNNSANSIVNRLSCLFFALGAIKSISHFHVTSNYNTSLD
ncbi:uncharacterized protein [Rutidosis leptorrhynchoides]